MDESMNDSYTEFIAPEDIKLTDNRENGSILTPEVNTHVVDEMTTHTKELTTNKKGKSQKKIP